MTYQLRYHEEIVDDLDTAYRWYENRSQGLGSRFLHECIRTVARIVIEPAMTAAGSDGIRSTRIRRFPYVVHFRLEDDVVVVYAIMFGGRDPSTWRDRL
jgi:mRNA-degrading endonuclease RelE of RelBE toxin-antitoxin system